MTAHVGCCYSRHLGLPPGKGRIKALLEKIVVINDRGIARADRTVPFMEVSGSPDGIAAWLAAGARVPGVAGRWPLLPWPLRQKVL